MPPRPALNENDARFSGAALTTAVISSADMPRSSIDCLRALLSSTCRTLRHDSLTMAVMQIEVNDKIPSVPRIAPRRIAGSLDSVSTTFCPHDWVLGDMKQSKGADSLAIRPQAADLGFIVDAGPKKSFRPRANPKGLGRRLGGGLWAVHRLLFRILEVCGEDRFRGTCRRGRPGIGWRRVVMQFLNAGLGEQIQIGLASPGSLSNVMPPTRTVRLIGMRSVVDSRCVVILGRSMASTISSGFTTRAPRPSASPRRCLAAGFSMRATRL